MTIKVFTITNDIDWSKRGNEIPLTKVPNEYANFGLKSGVDYKITMPIK